MEKIVLTRISIEQIEQQLKDWVYFTFDKDNIRDKNSGLDLVSLGADVYDDGLFHNNTSDKITEYFVDDEGYLYYFNTQLGYYCGIDNTIIEKKDCIIK